MTARARALDYMTDCYQAQPSALNRIVLRRMLDAIPDDVIVRLAIERGATDQLPTVEQVHTWLVRNAGWAIDDFEDQHDIAVILEAIRGVIHEGRADR